MVSCKIGKEIFECAVIVYCNSLAYIQRIADTILLKERSFSRASIDDIVIFLWSFSEHMQQLEKGFQKLSTHDIYLNPQKYFLSHPSIALLCEKINALGLLLATDRLRAIDNLKFPVTLKQLQHYLGLTSRLRQFIQYYAMESAALHERKVAIYKNYQKSDF